MQNIHEKGASQNVFELKCKGEDGSNVALEIVEITDVDTEHSLKIKPSENIPDYVRVFIRNEVRRILDINNVAYSVKDKDENKGLAYKYSAKTHEKKPFDVNQAQRALEKYFSVLAEVDEEYWKSLEEVSKFPSFDDSLEKSDMPVGHWQVLAAKQAFNNALLEHLGQTKK